MAKEIPSHLCKQQIERIQIPDLKKTGQIFEMKYPLFLLLFLLILPFGYGNTLDRTRTADTLKLDTHEIVPISDSRQYIRIKGSVENPVLLFLSGGPGDTVTGSMKQMFSKLSEEFLVVLWDIRSTGETAKLGNSKPEFTQELFERDTRELTGYLLNRFGKEKLYLAGLSWGTVLGFYMVEHHPELLHAFIAVSPIIDQVRSEKMSIELLMKEAGAENNETAVSELSLVEVPFKNADQLYYSRKWIFIKEGNSLGKKKSFKKYVYNWSATWLELFNEGIQTNLFESLPAVECPVYFIVGKNDYRTLYTLAEAYYKDLKAPVKGFFLFENSGHLIPYQDRARFQKTIIDSILKK
ncbi:alpha/beta fold hydrolase [Robiginitalea aurantiaca]|uniref:Alpha/beta hydrolase n=1 Tax=Robiginitalea aurantiaca TaxID=3056915 RepID=A0ABT7WCN8_9FLAO|nr:alpha/beta hydrolase [Robiginitalea aurantiaca]MDM9630676.1 alpha/beta hydrolase [Robiginitalea aurantiaca]